MSRRRIIVVVLGVGLVLWIVLVLAFSSLLADPTSGSGRGDRLRTETTER